jgi:hypothetical protein
MKNKLIPKLPLICNGYFYSSAKLYEDVNRHLGILKISE